MSINPYEVAGFEVHWRPFVTNGWHLVLGEETLEAADARSEQALKDWGGQTRIVSQSVVHAEGLGAEEFIPRAIRRAAAAKERKGLS